MVLKISFILLTLITNLFLIFIGFKAIDKTLKKQIAPKALLITLLIAWQVYIYLLSSTDVLLSYDFPPLFALAFIIPSFIFTGIFLYWNRNKKWITSIPEHWIIYFQSFRILVETLFVFAFTQGIFNQEVTIEGYNFDMIFAITAPLVAYFVYTKKVISKRLLIQWNCLGIGVLSSVIIVFMISIYKPTVFGGTAPLLPMESMTYPYVLIAGFLMPVAVFLHVLSILQLKKRSK